MVNRLKSNEILKTFTCMQIFYAVENFDLEHGRNFHFHSNAKEA